MLGSWEVLVVFKEDRGPAGYKTIDIVGLDVDVDGPSVHAVINVAIAQL